MTTSLQRAVAPVNRMVHERFVLMLAVTVGIAALWPSLALAMKGLRLCSVPGTGWVFDAPTLSVCLIMLSASTQCRVRDFAALARAPRPFLVGVGLLYVLLPLVGCLAARIAGTLLGAQLGPQIATGLTLVVLMPVGMGANVWVRLAKGNASLLVTLVTLTSALSLVLTPIYLSVLTGLSAGHVDVPVATLVRQLVLAVICPMLIGLVLRARCEAWVHRWQALISLGGSLGVFLALFANMGVALPRLRELGLPTLALLVLLVLGLNLLNGLLSYGAGRALLRSSEDAATICFAGAMRSNGTALLIGLKCFPMFPLVTIPAALYLVVQHLVARQVVRLMVGRARAPSLAARLSSVQAVALVGP